MKLVIASDIHGAADACARLMSAVEVESPDRIVLLGDLLYHGPRNDLPADYAPKRVIEVLNSVPQWLGDLERELAPADFGVVRFTVENPVECGEILDACFRGKTPGFDYTRGLFHRGVE